jgi:hypothetical protein
MELITNFAPHKAQTCFALLKQKEEKGIRYGNTSDKHPCTDGRSG